MSVSYQSNHMQGRRYIRQLDGFDFRKKEALEAFGVAPVGNLEERGGW